MIFKIICSARRPYPVALPNHWYIAAHPDVGYPALLLPGQISQPNIFLIISVLQMSLLCFLSNGSDLCKPFLFQSQLNFLISPWGANEEIESTSKQKRLAKIATMGEKAM